MNNTTEWPTGCIERIVYTYGDMLFRLCLITLGNSADAEDALQETFIKYMQKAPQFKDEEHEKAWLITVATNKCRDMLRFNSRHPVIDMEEIKELSCDNTDNSIMEALMALPDKFRLVLILYYIEEYSIKEIADIIGRTPSAVKMRLQKGRNLLKDKYRKEYM